MVSLQHEASLCVNLQTLCKAMAVDSVIVADPFSQRVVFAGVASASGPYAAVTSVVGLGSGSVTAPVRSSFAQQAASPVTPAALVGLPMTWSNIAQAVPLPTSTSTEIDGLAIQNPVRVIVEE